MKAFAILLMITVKTVLGAPINPDENRDIEDPDLFEGDMYLTPEQRGYAMMGLDVFTSNRQGASIKGPLWPGGVVVYDIAPALGHAIGFFHEQSRPDRDTYITILTENIQAGTFENSSSRCDDNADEYDDNDDDKSGRKKHNFRKYDRSLIDSLGTPYDYRSVMHYSAKAFTKNGLPTLMVKQEGFQNVIGQRNGLSAIDADQAKKLYRCAFFVLSFIGEIQTGRCPPRTGNKVRFCIHALKHPSQAGRYLSRPRK
ncbi:unnamed protein product [Porites lobata]|uniref:Metalloendopeptidase n=1 Tax=Porites lobata TaxID=104759 RepID=A0ABN8NTC5_9CNID|nr:unnamed protein product [Porites lobata]